MNQDNPLEQFEPIDVHSESNKAAIDYAKTVTQLVKNPSELTKILGKIQEVRMLVNAAICYERLGVRCKDYFHE